MSSLLYLVFFLPGSQSCPRLLFAAHQLRLHCCCLHFILMSLVFLMLIFKPVPFPSVGILNRNLRHFYSRRHFVNTIRLYLDFYIVLLQIIFLIVNCKWCKFRFDIIETVNRFLLFVFIVMRK